MKKMTKNGILVNFNNNYCKNKEDILNSSLFIDLLERFIEKIDRKKIDYYEKLIKYFDNNKELEKEIIAVFKLCLLFPFKDTFSSLKIEKEAFLEFVEEFYNYYRKFERYSYYFIDNDSFETIQDYLNKDQQFNSLILETYRKISENIKDEHYLVYRQLNAGSNAGFILMKNIIEFEGEYSKLNNVPLINSIVLHPPFIAYPKNTKREGYFKESKVNPIEYFENNDNYLCYAINVGRYVAYCYFEVEYALLGVSLANLFTPLNKVDLLRKPDIIFIYGERNFNEDNPEYYYDSNEDIYIGIAPFNEEMTYFGYMKKMLLTLHNLKCIDNNELPLHGAMVSLKLVNGIKKNIVIIGDSGAGKSETLEALKNILDEDISEMYTVFDDMGSINKDLIAYGSETGAFVRMDDLDIGYAYKELDRSILLNPDKNNARTIIPITSLKDIIKGHKIDMFLYANNYEDKEGIRVFNDYSEALEVFENGKRYAKSTTSEVGIVSSYFANPFGPLQKKEYVNILLKEYFNKLFNEKIVVGEIYTRLGIKGEEKSGPLSAAKSLIKFIK